MNIIAVVNLKGGVGKTATSVQLGAALAACGRRVLLVDMDLQHGLTSYFKLGVRERVTTESVLLDGAALRDGAQNVREKLDIVPASSRMEIADKDLPHQPGGELRLRLAVNDLQLQNPDSYDYIFLDCPSGWGAVVRNALLASTHLLLPINSEPPALRSARETLQKARELGRYFAHDVPLAGALLTCWRNTKTASSVANSSAKAWPTELFTTRVRRGERINELSIHGETLFDSSSTRNVGLREDYERLAMEVITRCEPKAKATKAALNRKKTTQKATA